MTEEKNLETYLTISPKKYCIYLIDKKDLKKLYEDEVNIDKDVINFDTLIKFLDDNIFKIERSIGKFIKNIFLIIDNNEVSTLNIGVKNKNYDEIDNKNNLENILIETKDLFRKNYHDQKIMHMLINTYFVNNKYYSSLENAPETKDFCLIIKFISISKNFSDQLEKTLERYQIKIKKYLHGGYVKEFFKEEEIDFPVMICNILNGLNKNEVQLVQKNEENKGFFEKFFQIFS